MLLSQYLWQHPLFYKPNDFEHHSQLEKKNNEIYSQLQGGYSHGNSTE